MALPRFEESESPRMPYNCFSGRGVHSYPSKGPNDASGSAMLAPSAKRREIHGASNHPFAVPRSTSTRRPRGVGRWTRAGKTPSLRIATNNVIDLTRRSDRLVET
jgi:hypothetical protein